MNRNTKEKEHFSQHKIGTQCKQLEQENRKEALAEIKQVTNNKKALQTIPRSFIAKNISKEDISALTMSSKNVLQRKLNEFEKTSRIQEKITCHMDKEAKDLRK